MAKIHLDPGICGFKTTVLVKKRDGKRVCSVSVLSDCEMVRKLGAGVNEVSMTDLFKKMLDNPVYVRGSVCLKHTSCPVPWCILKAVEAELGLAVPKDVTMKFERE